MNKTNYPTDLTEQQHKIIENIDNRKTIRKYPIANPLKK
jgi:hypothetical protein